MAEEEKTPRKKSTTLVQKLLEVRKSVDYLQKASEGAQFKYTSSSQVLTAVRDQMNKLGLILVTHVLDHKLIPSETGTDQKSRTTYFTELILKMVWIDAETGESMEIPWYGQGVDIAGEKGVGKALTYAEKYFILKQFNIPTDKDDPDSHQEKAPSTIGGAAAQASVADRMAERLNNLVMQLESAKTIEEITEIWTKNIDMQTNQQFVAAVTKAGARINGAAK